MQMGLLQFSPRTHGRCDQRAGVPHAAATGRSRALVRGVCLLGPYARESHSTPRTGNGVPFWGNGVLWYGQIAIAGSSEKCSWLRYVYICWSGTQIKANHRTRTHPSTLHAQPCCRHLRVALRFRFARRGPLRTGQVCAVLCPYAPTNALK